MSNFQSLDVTTLETVTGGKAVKGSSNNEALTASLTSITSSLADLKNKPPQQGGLFGNSNNMMLFALLAMNKPAPQPGVVVVRRW